MAPFPFPLPAPPPPLARFGLSDPRTNFSLSFFQALDVYAKAAKRFPREYDIYLDLAEGVECVSPQQNVFVHQALASCLRRVVGKRYLAPDVRDLADGFTARLREIKLEHPKPKRLPPRTPGLPTKREGEVATTAAALLVGKLMESRKRQEPQYEVAIQVVEGLGSWLDHCRAMAGRGYESEDGNDEEPKDAEYLDSDSDVRGGDSNDDGTDEEEDDDEEAAAAAAADRDDHDDGIDSSADEEDLDRADNAGWNEPMDNFQLDPGIVSHYGICQLYCGDKEKADKALCFLKDEDPSGPRGDMMIEVAKVRAAHFLGGGCAAEGGACCCVVLAARTREHAETSTHTCSVPMCLASRLTSSRHVAIFGSIIFFLSCEVGNTFFGKLRLFGLICKPQLGREKRALE